MMNLICVNDESFIAKVAANDDLGNSGVVSLHIDRSVRPKVLPCSFFQFILFIDQASTKTYNISRTKLT